MLNYYSNLPKTQWMLTMTSNVDGAIIFWDEKRGIIKGDFRLRIEVSTPAAILRGLI